MAAWKFRLNTIPVSSSSRHPVVQALLEQRGYRDGVAQDVFLSPLYDRDLHDPFLFSQMQRVVDRLEQSIARKETIGIFGDYDADGVTSSVIAREAIEGLGGAVVVYIPEKESEGHGLNLGAVDFFAEKKCRLVFTLDCGMMNHTEITEAKHRGMEVIIVDHHHVPEVLPEAYAIINPKLPDEQYPFKELCGAGTTFKVAQALYRKLAPEKEEQLKWLLDVAATGTVADVMPLVGENRVLVKYGLIVLSRTRRIGFQEMFAVGGLGIHEEKPPVARSIAFSIAPRINAASRMAHAMLAHDLLVATDPVHARTLALELEAHNTERQKVSTQVTNMVKKLAETEYRDKKFIFAAHEHYPYGIVGLVAGRVANTYRKPTCVLTKYAETSTGSFRSIPECNIIEALEEVSDLLMKYGGHAQAAGMTIKNENLDTFYTRFNAIIEKQLAGVVTEPELWIDMKILPEHVTPELLRALAQCAPFGEGNPEPVFCLENMLVKQLRMVGNGNKHLKISFSSPDGTKVFDAIGFSLGEAFSDLQTGARVDVACQLDENTWNGRTSIQLKLIDMRVR